MRHAFTLLFGLLIVILGCTPSTKTNTTAKKSKNTTASGYKYKQHINKKGEKIQVGEEAAVNVTLRRADNSLVQKGRINNIILPENTGKSALLEGVSMMGIGDSLTVFVPVDSIPIPPPNFKSGEMIHFDLAMRSIKSKEVVAKEQAENAIKQKAAEEALAQKIKEEQENANIAPKYQQEMAAARAKAPIVSKDLQQRIKQYRSGILSSRLQTMTVDGHTLKYIIHQEGTGDKIQDGQTAYVQYAGSLINGKEFDASFPKGRPFSFPIGQGRAIRGWDAAIPLLRKGGAATLFIPHQLAYGEQGYPPIIPPNSELIFYVELVEIR